MNKPGPMQWVADPPEVWAGVIDVLVAKILGMERDLGPLGGCPPWPGQVACPLKTDGVEKCWGEAACWVYWAYMLTVMKMATESAKKATDPARMQAMTTPAVRDVLQSYEDELVPLTWDSSLGETVSWCIKNGLLERDPVERRSIGGQVLACEFRITELGRYLLTALCGKEQP